MGVNPFSGNRPPRPKVSPSPQPPAKQTTESLKTDRRDEEDPRDVFEAICGDDIQETGYDGDCP